MKTFPIILTDTLHKKIKLESVKRGQSIKDFIIAAILDSLRKTEE